MLKHNAKSIFWFSNKYMKIAGNKYNVLSKAKHARQLKS